MHAAHRIQVGSGKAVVSPLIAHNKMSITIRDVPYFRRGEGKEAEPLRFDGRNSEHNDGGKNDRMILSTVDNVRAGCYSCRLRYLPRGLLWTRYACSLCK